LSRPGGLAFRQAHADPDNRSYKRQPWFEEDALRRPTEHDDSHVVTDIGRVGATNCYRSSTDWYRERHASEAMSDAAVHAMIIAERG
jgi:hypothetical protein